MSEAETIISRTELNKMEIVCGECKTTTVTITIEEGKTLPEHCPTCKKPFDNGFQEALRAYRRFFTLAEVCKHSIQFRIGINRPPS